MKAVIIDCLRCPKSGEKLLLETGYSSNIPTEIIDGWLVTESGAHRYPIRGGIPRFVPESNYADNFGMQWNH